jgi:hypothetical protein
MKTQLESKVVTPSKVWAIKLFLTFHERFQLIQARLKMRPQFLTTLVQEERGDVPGWVLVVLMTTGLVTGIWTVAAPRLSTILRSSLDSMNNVR